MRIETAAQGATSSFPSTATDLDINMESKETDVILEGQVHSSQQVESDPWLSNLPSPFDFRPFQEPRLVKFSLSENFKAIGINKSELRPRGGIQLALLSMWSLKE